MVPVSSSGLEYYGAPSAQIALRGHSKGLAGESRLFAAAEEDVRAGEESGAVGDELPLGRIGVGGAAGLTGQEVWVFVVAHLRGEQCFCFWGLKLVYTAKSSNF